MGAHESFLSPTSSAHISIFPLVSILSNSKLVPRPTLLRRIPRIAELYTISPLQFLAEITNNEHNGNVFCSTCSCELVLLCFTCLSTHFRSLWNKGTWTTCFFHFYKYNLGKSNLNSFLNCQVFKSIYPTLKLKKLIYITSVLNIQYSIKFIIFSADILSCDWVYKL